MAKKQTNCSFSSASIREKTYAIPKKQKLATIKLVEKCSGNQGNIFKLISHLRNIKAKPTLPFHENTIDLCKMFNEFFISTIVTIREKLNKTDIPDDLVSMSLRVFNGDSLMQWQEITTEELRSIVKELSNATCKGDRMPTKLIKTCLLDTLLPVITKIINLSVLSQIAINGHMSNHSCTYLL